MYRSDASCHVCGVDWAHHIKYGEMYWWLPWEAHGHNRVFTGWCTLLISREEVSHLVTTLFVSMAGPHLTLEMESHGLTTKSNNVRKICRPRPGGGGHWLLRKASICFGGRYLKDTLTFHNNVHPD